MTNHLKAEIIYYKCATDFEFEFSMNSICQMRLLSEASNERKTMLTHLSRAVSRSRIIFITSPFNDEFIDTVSHSIGFKTETIIAEEYGITQSATQKLITSGVPLVTEDGVYAGIILECGPQSLVLLTDDRSLRKKIMKSLVKQYILDLCNCAPIQGNTTFEGTKTEVAAPSYDGTSEDVTEETHGMTDSPGIIEDTAEDITNITDTPDSFIDNPVVAEKQIKKGLTVLTVVLSVILFVLVAFIVFSLIIEPTINGISIIENLKKTFRFLF